MNISRNIVIVAATMLIMIVAVIADSGDEQKTWPAPSINTEVTHGDSPGAMVRDDLSRCAQEREERATVIRSYVDAPLNEILSHPVKCERIADEQEPFDRLKEIHHKSLTDRPEKPSGPPPPPDKFESRHSVATPEAVLEARKLRHSVATPEQVKDLMDRSEGHISLGYPNRTTIIALKSIWEQAPCSEAAAVALLDIGIMYIWPPEGPYACTGIKDPFLTERKKISNFIIANYPGTWEAQRSQGGQAADDFGQNSDEFVNALYQWLFYLEKNDVANNPYYQFRAHENSAVKPDQNELIKETYGRIAGIYLERCEYAAREEDYKGRSIPPPEAIEDYEKYLKVMAEWKERHPENYTGQRSEMLCIWYIKKYAPDKYRPVPPPANQGAPK